MDEGASREGKQRDSRGTRPGAGTTGARRALGLRAKPQVWGSEEVYPVGPGARGGRARLAERGWGSGPYFAFSLPQEKKQSWREAERTATLISSPGLRGQARAAAAGRRRGTGLTHRVNRSRPRPAKGPGRRSPSRLSPPPRAGRPAPGSRARLSPLQRPLRGRPGPGRWGGGGAGVPRRRILPRGWRRGEGPGPGTGGLRRTRARHEHGPREASWVKSGRAAPGERGEEPGSEVRALEPGWPSPRPAPT